jgi:hypothetical protein
LLSLAHETARITLVILSLIAETPSEVIYYWRFVLAVAL